MKQRRYHRDKGARRRSVEAKQKFAKIVRAFVYKPMQTMYTAVSRSCLCHSICVVIGVHGERFSILWTAVVVRVYSWTRASWLAAISVIWYLPSLSAFVTASRSGYRNECTVEAVWRCTVTPPPIPFFMRNALRGVSAIRPARYLLIAQVLASAVTTFAISPNIGFGWGCAAFKAA